VVAEGRWLHRSLLFLSAKHPFRYTAIVARRRTDVKNSRV